ncbi:MAG TPA: PhzF family phenazine biosynthesis isomerase [Parachlamydiaceae bacterium]|nr:PhzF family phenazine biosynthesis isomerase [Parachlamydiaceae bacterium]
MNTENRTSLARCLVDLFYPLVEATLYNAEGRVQEIFNAFSTIKEDQIFDIHSVQTNTPFSELLVGGKNVKNIIYPFYQDQLIIGYLKVRYDLTHFKNLQEQLNFLVQANSQSTPQLTIDPWKQAIDQIIHAYLAENKINLQAISAKQKRELFSRLQEKGLFDFKESSAYVASKLQISRATLYNYLKTTANFSKIHVHQVDAFTNKRFGGNPAGVVLDAEDLDEITMRKIARELNLSETAFVFSSDKAAFQLRYFTPTGHEITFCGHSTVGALYMIAKEQRFGMEKAGLYPLDVETPCGVLRMEVKIEANEEIKVAYETPKIKLLKTKISHFDVAKAGGFEEHLINSTFPVMYEETNKDLFVVIHSLEALKKIECDPKSFAQFSKQHDIVALCLFCPEAFDSENQFHMRCFAPLVGIPEDPFTGSVLGGLTAYVDTFGILSKDVNSFRVEQGHFIERPGVVKVEYSRKGKTYHAKVLAQAVHCFSTEINLT